MSQTNGMTRRGFLLFGLVRISCQSVCVCVCVTLLCRSLSRSENGAHLRGFEMFGSRKMSLKTKMHTAQFWDPKCHRSNRIFVFSGPRYTDLHTAVRSMDWLEATQSITNLKGHRNSPPPSQFRVLTCWVHLVCTVQWYIYCLVEIFD